jgi:hypothetical protein
MGLKVKVLHITLKYSKRKRKKLYSEVEVIDFGDYSDMLLYISDIDELRQEIKKLTDVLEEGIIHAER